VKTVTSAPWSHAFCHKPLIQTLNPRPSTLNPKLWILGSKS
jgi:hypothetical protein